MDEGAFVSFIGTLQLAREVGSRQVSAASLPQYVSAIRQLQIAMTKVPVPDFPMVPHVMRGYARLEEANFPQDEVRCGISADIMMKVWALSMSSPTLSTIRDCAASVFSFCFNGLRESTVMSIYASKVAFAEDTMAVRLYFFVQYDVEFAARRRLDGQINR